MFSQLGQCPDRISRSAGEAPLMAKRSSSPTTVTTFFKALHLVSAWASDHRLVLAQVKVDPMSNEITAIPELLQLLDIKGCIITIDAMGATVVDCDPNYPLIWQITSSPSKPILASSIRRCSSGRSSNIPRDLRTLRTASTKPLRRDITESKFAEERSVSISALGQLSQLNQWSGMHCLGIAVRERRLWNRTTLEVRFYLSSLPPDAALLAVPVRSHWQIENTLHALVGCHLL